MERKLVHICSSEIAGRSTCSDFLVRNDFIVGIYEALRHGRAREAPKVGQPNGLGDRRGIETA
eukprot:2478289-Prorocentrum_lima.AAC.1